MSWYELTVMRTKSSSEPKFANGAFNVERERGTSSLPTKFLTSSTPPLTQTDPPCCVAASHFLTQSLTDQNTYSRHGSNESIININISDLNGDEDGLATTQSLRYCQRRLLKPYNLLLLLIGWRPFHKEQVTKHPVLWKIVNTIYPILVLGLMTYYSILKVVLCEGKLNILRDTLPLVSIIPPHRDSTTPRTSHNTSTSTQGYLTHHFNITRMDMMDKPQCEHLFPNYIIPCALQLAAYLYGLRLFRIQDNEQLYSLMERVFVRSQSNSGTHDILIRNSRIQFVGASIWILLHLGTEALYNVAYEFETTTVAEVLGIEDVLIQSVIIVLKFLGLFMVQVVNVAVILNYCTQCEMLIMYIRGICLWLREKTVNVKQAMHEILGVREFIGLLNSKMGKMTALCVITFSELFIIGLALLLFNQVDAAAVWTYRVAYPCVWLLALMYPLIQAARLSKIGQKLRQITFEMRVFGYQTASQLELDSFIMFVNNATLRAKLFGVAIRPSFLVICLGGTGFVLLLLMTVGIVNINHNRFF